MLGRATVVVIAGAALLTALVAPIKLCPVALMFARPCPGCGMTRAAWAMLRGDFGSALAFQPLVVAVLPFATWLSVKHIASYVRTGNPWRLRPLSRATETLAAALVALLLVVWVARFFGFFGGPVRV